MERLGWSEEARRAWNEKMHKTQIYNETGTTDAKIDYRRASRRARNEARKAGNREMLQLSKHLESDDGRRKIFKMARRLAGEGKDLSGVKCLRVGSDGDR